MPQGTRFAGCSRGQAAGILVLLVAALGWCVWVALTQETIPARPAATGQGPEVQGDAEFHGTIVRRVHAGDNYYDAYAAELRQRGYVPHSMFNWRLPPYAWLLGKLPSPLWGQCLLILGALVTLGLGYGVTGRAAGQPAAAAYVVLGSGPFLWCLFPDLCLFTELWAGLLIALSVWGYAGGNWRLGLIAGLGALCFRELALPYCLLSLAAACWQRRGREVAWWLAGLTLCGLLLGWHGLEASRRIPGTEVLHATAWVQFGGTAFVLLTTQINFLLILAPAWVAALYLPPAFLGLASWRGPLAVRAGLTAGVFVAAFCVIGVKPHNAYWGLMYAPLLPIGLVRAPAAVRDLCNAAFRPRVQDGPARTRPADAPCLEKAGVG